MGLLASALVRRRWFELFYWSHHVFLALFAATLWHATASWQYVLGGLALWFLDRLLRLGDTTREVFVHSLHAVATDDSAPDSEVCLWRPGAPTSPQLL